MHLDSHTHNTWLIVYAYAFPLEERGLSKAEGQAACKTKLN